MTEKKKREVKTIDIKDMELASVIQANPGFQESVIKTSQMMEELRELGFTLEDDEEYDPEIHVELK